MIAKFSALPSTLIFAHEVRKIPARWQDLIWFRRFDFSGVSKTAEITFYK